MDGNIKDTPPVVFVPDAADRARWDAARRRARPTSDRQVEARKQAARPEFDKWLAAGQTPRRRLDDGSTPPTGEGRRLDGVDGAGDSR